MILKELVETDKTIKETYESELKNLTCYTASKKPNEGRTTDGRTDGWTHRHSPCAAREREKIPISFTLAGA